MEEHIPYPRHRWIYLILCALCGIVWQLTMLSLSPLIEKIAGDLHVDYAMAANLMTAFVVTAGITCMIGGSLVDRFGTMTILVGGTLCAALGAALMPLAGSNYWAVMGLRILEGVAYGGMCTMGPTVALWFPQNERGTVAGLLGVLASVGAITAVFAGPLVYEAVGSWQGMSAVFSIYNWLVLVALIWLVWRFDPNAYEAVRKEHARGESGEHDFRRVLGGPVFWLGIALVVLIQWGHLNLSNLGPGYLAASIGLGFGPVIAGQLGLAITVSMGLGPLFVGAVLLRLLNASHKAVLSILFIVATLSLHAIIVPAVSTNIPALVLGLALAGATTASVIPMLAPYAAEVFPHSVVGRVTGLWIGIGTFSGGWTVSLGGLLLARTGNYVMTYTMAAAAVAIGFVVTLFLSETKRQPVRVLGEPSREGS
jgi:MFS family permease